MNRARSKKKKPTAITKSTEAFNKQYHIIINFGMHKNSVSAYLKKSKKPPPKKQILRHNPNLRIIIHHGRNQELFLTSSPRDPNTL